jgi:hypothetical protein
MADGRALLEESGQKIIIKSIAWNKHVTFEAAIQTFRDSYKSEWKEEFVYNRMDPIATFIRTGRVIEISFDVVAESAAQAAHNFQAAQLLADMQYPQRTAGGDESVIRMGPLFEVRFMNWITDNTGYKGLLGFMNGFTFEPELVESGVFGSGITSNTLGLTEGIYPMKFPISFNLTVIHRERRTVRHVA